MASVMTPDVYIGKRFGRLLVVKEIGLINKSRHWIVKCDCGTEKDVYQQSLLSGSTTSCGCYRKEVVTTHGMSKTRIYSVWNNMLTRCHNILTPNYDNYGGRGIGVCDRWKKFENFYSDMGDIPDGMSLDRIDNNGNYEPSNCKWSTPSEQQRNKSNNHLLTVNGITKTLIEWAIERNLKYTTIIMRLNYGYTEEQAVFSGEYSKH